MRIPAVPAVAPAALAGALLAALAPTADAQLSETYGPEVAPLDSPVVWSQSNDMPFSVLHDPCGFAVFSVAGQLVYDPPCGGPVTLEPGGVFTQAWKQVDQSGQPVPQGLYRLAAPDGPLIVVGGTKPAIAPLGGHHVGTTRALQLASPLDPGEFYLLLASGPTTGAIPTCGGSLPLQNDSLLAFSLSAPGVFQSTIGLLNFAGVSKAPKLAIPNDSSLASLEVQLAFVVLELGQPCLIRRVSLPYTLTVY